MTTTIKYAPTRECPIARVSPGETFLHNEYLCIMTDRIFDDDRYKDAGWVVDLSNGYQFSLHEDVIVQLVDITIEVKA